MADDINVSVEDAFSGHLPPLEIEDEDAPALPPGAGVDGEPVEPEFTVGVDQIENLLRMGYQAGAWKTGYDDIWAVTDEEVYEIAKRIVVDINRFPVFMRRAVSAADHTSGWGMLVFSYASRIRASMIRRREEEAGIYEQR